MNKNPNLSATNFEMAKRIHGELSLTPLALVCKVDEDSQILQHSNQWVEMIDPVISALQAALSTNMAKSTYLFKKIAAHLSSTNSYHQKNERYQFSELQDGPPPKDLETPQYVNGKAWYFCTKYSCNGRWVCTRTDSTHRTQQCMDRHSGGSHSQGRRHFSPSRGSYHNDDYLTGTGQHRRQYYHTPGSPSSSSSGRSNGPQNPASSGGSSRWDRLLHDTGTSDRYDAVRS